MSTRVALADGLVPATILVDDGRVSAVLPHGKVPAGVMVEDVGDLAILPGLVDTHVHLNEPGRTEWEGFATGTAAAAAGGITTIIEMPLNAVPATTTLAALEAKRQAARGRLRVDVGFWGGVVPGNTADLEPLWRAGVFGFKCFLVPSGVDEFAAVGEGELREALPVLARLGAPLLVHAELPGPIDAAGELETCVAWDGRSHDCWLASRPPQAETEAVELMARLAESTGARVHIVHVSAAAVLPLLARARAAGALVSAETCPHYLFFAAEDVPEGGCQFKCAPPIRSRANNTALFAALRSGALDLVASDHSPCPPALKRLESGDLKAAWGGIASLELGLRVVWTLARRHGVGLEQVASWMAAAPARLAGLDAKGRLAPGSDADLVVFDPDAESVVDQARLLQRHPLTPYHGARLSGAVRRTYLRGRLVFDGAAMAGPAFGQVLTRT